MSGEETVAPSALGGGDGPAAGAAGAGAMAAPHSGQKCPGVAISRLQDGQTDIGEGRYSETRDEGTENMGVPALTADSSPPDG